MTDTPMVALQLYSVRNEVEKDIATALKGVAKLGYKGAELWGYEGDDLTWMSTPAGELRKLYDDSGLQCCGMHVTTEALQGDKLKRTIEMNQILGNKFLIIVTDKPRMQGGVDSIKELAGILNSVADTLLPLGMATGYHAHPHDFTKVGDETAWEVLFSHTVDDVVMQLDVLNCVNGDSDPAAILRRFAGRTRTVHLQDLGCGSGALDVAKQVDWEGAFAVMDALHPVEWYVVKEVGTPGFDVAARRMAALKAMGRA